MAELVAIREKHLRDNEELFRSFNFGKTNGSKKLKRSYKKNKDKSVASTDSKFQPTPRVTRSMSGTSTQMSSSTNKDIDNKVKYSVIENTFGEIKGIDVGAVFNSRLECSHIGLHRPTVSGIHGNADDGCYSIVLSGGYEDDVDDGHRIIYTGSGGRDLKGTPAKRKNLRTAPQSKDQELEGRNYWLSLNTESKKPVRVIRGFKLKSPFAPESGYRYDGLYNVERYWSEKGKAGFLVYKFELKRCPGQAPAPWEI